MTRFFNSIAILTALFLGFAVAQDNNVPLTRDEVSTVKKKLVNALDAIGQPPAGYSKEKENFNLPTDVYKNRETGLFYPVNGSADRTFGSEKNAEKSNKDLQKEYEKKIAEAQAKGDYQALMQATQEMQKKAGEMQLKTIEGKKEPIEVTVHINSNSNASIDPDAVVFERSGVIALKAKNDGTDEKDRIDVYFDPISLKDTKQLSKVDTKMPENGVNSKTAIYTVTIEFYGPSADIEAWAKKVDTGKVLAQINGK